MNGRIISDIEKERAAQDVQHGGPVNDDKHSLTVWVAIFTDHLGKLARTFWSGNSIAYRYQLVRIAAIAVAAIESYDRRQAKAVENYSKEK